LTNWNYIVDDNAITLEFNPTQSVDYTLKVKVDNVTKFIDFKLD